jgi:alpha/beta superfamily hydrolase
MGWRLPNFNLLHKELEINILAVSYRGYGESEGEPSESGLQMDALAALDWVKTQPEVNKKLVFLFGRSLGGAVALHLAKARDDEVSSVSDLLLIVRFVVRLLKTRSPQCLEWWTDFFLCSGLSSLMS